MAGRHWSRILSGTVRKANVTESQINFECHDIIAIGNDMEYSRLAHVPDQGVVFRMASLSNFENHFISKTF